MIRRVPVDSSWIWLDRYRVSPIQAMSSSARASLRSSAPRSPSSDGMSRVGSARSKASWTHSSTVSVGNSAASWKDRIRPRRPRASGLYPVMSRPPYRTVPASVFVNPVSSSNVVVLPAPFGPIRPRVSPALTSNDTPRTAWMPPKLLTIPSASSSAPERGARCRRAGARSTGAVPCSVRYSLKPRSSAWTASTATPARRASQFATRSRVGVTSCPSPPGRYMMMSSCPKDVAASPAVSSGRNVTPPTKAAPIIGPDSNPRPPMTAILTTSIEMLVGKLVEDTSDSEWPYMAPPRPAMNPARANPWSLTEAAGTVKARAASSLSRTATRRRPRPPARTLRAMTNAMTTVTRPT